ncbi:MAG: Holliday junction branch migration protein RuvA [Clostridia bacterium]|nr:Holliday junction branch migration protein RuvA [Clostridia bacterium]
MIAYVRGRVLTTTAETVIVDIGGIGYEIYCSKGAFEKATAGETVELYTHLQVKEDGMTLYGFATPAEKELYLKLISVSDVGPKKGITILSGMSMDDFVQAVATADSKRLLTVKGLGKKTAEKIILEMHGKISAAEILESDAPAATTPVKGQESVKLTKQDEEAVAALTGLGFTRSESVQAIKRAKEKGATTTEEIVLRAIQGF